MTARYRIQRAAPCVLLAALVGITPPLEAQHAGLVVDAGVGHFSNISRAHLVTTALIQADFFQVAGVRVISGIGGTFNLQDRSVPGGTGTRRTDMGTARLGLESPPVHIRNAQLFASASIAGSWFWHEYGGSVSEFGRVNGGGWVSGIYGVRAHFGEPDAPGLSLRYEIRPRYGTLASWNPYFGIGIAF